MCSAARSWDAILNSNAMNQTFIQAAFLLLPLHVGEWELKEPLYRYYPTIGQMSIGRQSETLEG